MKEPTWTLSFFAPGVPRPQPRPRTRKDGVTFTPGTANPWKHQVRASVVLAMSQNPAVQPAGPWAAFEVRVACEFQRPREHWRRAPTAEPVSLGGLPTRFRLCDDAPAVPIRRPDVDNLAKAILDAIGEWDGLPALLWVDDAQVTRLVIEKRYCDDPAAIPGAFVEIVCWDRPTEDRCDPLS